MNIFIYVAIAIIFALLSTRLMKQIKLPNVTGFLITGIIVGPCVLGLVFNGFDFKNSFSSSSSIYNFVNSLNWITVLALGFIAFTIGNNFKVSAIKQLGGKVVLITIFEAVGAAVLVFLGLFIARYFEIQSVGIGNETITWPLILTMSAISCATAPAATLLVVRQYKARGPVVNTLLPVVALDDAAALVAFSILFGIAKTMIKGSKLDLELMVLTPILEIVLSFGIGVILGVAIALLCRFFKSRANRTGLCIFAILLNIGIYYLFLNIELPYFGTIELSYLLMCMTSSAFYVNIFKESDRTMERLDVITPIVFMLFFVLSGANLDLTIFVSDNVQILLIIASTYLIFRVIGKCLGSYLSTSITKCDKQVRKHLGFTLIPQAGVAIGLATSAGASLGTDGGIGSIIVASVLISTIIYELVGPVITKVALEKAGEIGQGIE